MTGSDRDKIKSSSRHQSEGEEEGEKKTLGGCLQPREKTDSYCSLKRIAAAPHSELSVPTEAFRKSTMWHSESEMRHKSFARNVPTAFVLWAFLHLRTDENVNKETRIALP